ncbi:uncharacterized protein N7483_012378 [Penicillium malachiteum]|uniref:uncharacterized protein n=1 Tax=Penicillium malachiteum TaxID=1324776 RepID=UPI0025494A93|nr:uncharacterized protein N7483_012378 [Penicillium malachiteum]KAJ5715197.1 hypothetical protein N7483_012378 [Penicillium malachiteum]
MVAGATLSHDHYTVGWICALPLEMAAAKLMMDSIHPSLPSPSTDQNTYILGNIGEHNIVIACLPGGAYGNVSAATVAMQLLSTFHSIRFGLMVGIGGGIPSSNADIRLGDIVVSQPRDTFGGVIQYDLGKVLHDGQFQRTGMLNRPPKVLLTAIATLQAHHLTEDSQLIEFISNIHLKITSRKATTFTRPVQEDCLYQAEYEHGAADTCTDCDRSKLTQRSSREHDEPVIHYGLIASANQVVKDGRRRDQLAQDLGVYCIEMEAAGLINDFPCVVIRGICDYADSHKNKEWQGFAAAVAAAYAKELLLVVPVSEVDKTPIAQDSLKNSVDRFMIPLDLTAVPVIESFVGRQSDLDRLWQYFEPTNAQSRKVAILHGLGGIGKTQLAIRFARDRKNEFTAIFWLNGKDRSTLLQSLSSVLPRLPGHSQGNGAINNEELEQQANYVLDWLAKDGNSRWLLIFDNIDQYSPITSGIGDEYDIGAFFPSADHGSILITSRLPGLSELGKSFPVHRLKVMDAIYLLFQNSGLPPDAIKSLRDKPDTITLINHLDGLPLAVVIAAAFMRQTGTSITEYLHYYQQSWSHLQSQSGPGRQYQQGNILQTWIISYQEIQKRDPSAAKLLLLLACFDNRDIWYELVKGASHSSEIPSWLEGIISSGLSFKAHLKHLIGFSLLETKQEEGSYSMHPVLQNWCHHIARTESIANLSQLRELALISVGWTVPRANERNYSEIQQRLIPHANHVRLERLYGNNITVCGAFHGLGILFSNRGKLNEAEEMYQRALVGKEKALGPDHISTLYTVNNLGLLYLDQGKLKTAEKMYQRALTGYEKALGPDHTSTLDTVNNLGILYKEQGKLKEAEEMYQRALAGKEKALGPDHTSTLDTVNNLGLLYSHQGKLKTAEEMYQRALTGYEKALGPDHENHYFTLNTVNNLGILYKEQGKLKEAEEMYQRALAGKEKALGPDHTSTLDTMNNLGILYRDQGKPKEAEEMYQRALAGKEKALGPDHTSTLGTMNDLGILYRDQGKLKEAEEMYQRALAGYVKVLGPYHTSTLGTMKNLVLLYSDQGKLKEAEDIS